METIDFVDLLLLTFIEGRIIELCIMNLTVLNLKFCLFMHLVQIDLLKVIFVKHHL